MQKNNAHEQIFLYLILQVLYNAPFNCQYHMKTAKCGKIFAEKQICLMDFTAITNILVPY